MRQFAALGIGVYGATFANRYRLIIAGKSGEKKPRGAAISVRPADIQEKAKNRKLIREREK